MSRRTGACAARRSCNAALLLLLAACAGFERPADWQHHLDEASRANWTATGPVDGLDADAIWGLGDQVVYAIDIDGNGEHHHYTLTLTTEKLPAPTPERLHLRDPVRGRLLTQTAEEEFQWEPILVLSHTGKATVRAHLGGDDGTDCEGAFELESLANFWQERVGDGWTAGIHELFGALLHLDCMLQQLLTVIRPPSTLSVLQRLGRVDVAMHWPDPGPVASDWQDTPLGRVRTLWLPVALDANGQPALDGRVLFTWKQSPLLSCSGVLQIEAWHPDDRARRLSLRLVGARRGTPPDAPDPQDFGDGVRAGMTVAEVGAAVHAGAPRVLEQGRLGDGRAQLLEFQTEHVWLVGAFAGDRLLFAAPGDNAARLFLHQRGFVAD